MILFDYNQEKEQQVIGKLASKISKITGVDIDPFQLQKAIAETNYESEMGLPYKSDAKREMALDDATMNEIQEAILKSFDEHYAKAVKERRQAEREHLARKKTLLQK